MPIRKKKQINLIPQRGFSTTTIGRVLSWTLSSFRIIVVVTEIIVMVAFLSRFWLDAKNTDLSEELEKKQAVLAASLEFENNFKNVQQRLTIYSDYSKNEAYLANVIHTITNYLPADVFLTSLSFSKNSLNMKGESSSERGIQQAITNLESANLFESITLTKLESDQKNPTLMHFEIKTSLKN